MHTNKAGKKYWLLTETILLAFICFIGGCGGSGGDGAIGFGGAAGGNALTGQANLSDPLVGATLVIHSPDGLVVYYSQTNATGSTGMFSIPTNASVPQSFIVDLSGGTAAGVPFAGCLRIVINNYVPNTYYYVNEVTTLVADYMAYRPGTTYDQAVAAVKNYLKTPDNVTIEEIAESVSHGLQVYFSDTLFWQALGDPASITASDFKSFVQGIMADIDAGKQCELVDNWNLTHLPPLFDHKRAEGVVQPASTGPAASDTRTVQAIPAVIGGIIELVGTVLDTVSQIAEGDQQDATIESIQTKLDNIQADLTRANGFLNALTAKIDGMIATDANSEMIKIENHIDSARNSYTAYMKAKKPKLSDLDISQKRAKFLNLVRGGGKNANGTPANPTQALDYMLTQYVGFINKNDAFMKVAQAVVSNGQNYGALESYFLKKMEYLALGSQMLVEMKVADYIDTLADASKNKETIESTRAKVSADWSQTLWQDLNSTDDQALSKAVNALVPAVRHYFANQKGGIAAYWKWSRCDQTETYLGGRGSAKIGTRYDTTQKASVDVYECDETDKPFLRATYITNTLLGAHYPEVNSSPNVIYVALARLVDSPAPPSPALPNNRLSLCYVTDPTVISNYVQAQAGDVFTVDGLNPFYGVPGLSGTGEQEKAQWDIAIVKVPVSDNAARYIDMAPYPENRSLMPYEFNETFTYIHPYLLSNGKRRAFFSAWLWPVKDVQLYAIADRGGLYSWMDDGTDSGRFGRNVMIYDTCSAGSPWCLMRIRNINDAVVDYADLPLQLYRLGVNSNSPYATIGRVMTLAQQGRAGRALIMNQDGGGSVKVLPNFMPDPKNPPYWKISAIPGYGAATYQGTLGQPVPIGSTTNTEVYYQYNLTWQNGDMAMYSFNLKNPWGVAPAAGPLPFDPACAYLARSLDWDSYKWADLNGSSGQWAANFQANWNVRFLNDWH